MEDWKAYLFEYRGYGEKLIRFYANQRKVEDNFFDQIEEHIKQKTYQRLEDVILVIESEVLDKECFIKIKGIKYTPARLVYKNIANEFHILEL